VDERTPQPVGDGSCGRTVRSRVRVRAGRPPNGPPTWVRRGLWITLFAAVVGVSLWLGAHRPAPSTPTDRVEQIASQLRCPVCIDESAAQANTAAARAIRANVAARLRAGESDRQIIDYMVSRYGRWILLSPPATGFGLTVWIAPIAVALGAIGVVAVAWIRAARRFKEAELSAPGEEHHAMAGELGGQDGGLVGRPASTSK
jgi:cytochrome c-type biogenesis protein CcmH